MEKGWARPPYALKWHYFDEDGKSLCGHQFFTGPTEQGNEDSPDNCSTCRKRLKEGPKPKLTRRLPE